jgi:uncharacterized protein YjiS (DUF1127 family)
MSLITFDHGAMRGIRPALRAPSVDRLQRAAFAAMKLLFEGGALVRRWHARQHVRWLVNADDAVLRDLGIARSDIPRLVRMGRH